VRYMTFVKGSENQGPAPQAMYDAMDKHIAEQAKAGVFISGGGLAPTKESFRVRSKGGKLHVTDGPFTESKEVIGGFAIMEYATREEALEGAKQFMELHRIHWPEWDGECEFRPMVEA